MKKIVFSLSTFIFLFVSAFLLLSEEKNVLIDKFNYAGAIVYNENQNRNFDEDDLELLGTCLVIELEDVFKRCE